MPLRNTCLLSLLLLAGLLTPACAQSNYVGVRLPPQEILQRNGLTRVWWGQATTNSVRDRLIHITVDETNLYMQSSSGVITAFDSESGKRIWATQVGGADRAIYPASSNDELLLVVTGMSLFAVQKSDGTVRWDIRLPGQPASSPVADDRYLYIGFLDGSLYSFNIKQIDDFHHKGLLPTWSFQTVHWRYKTSKPIVTPAIPNGPLVAFASQNGSLYSVASSDRKLKFQFETDAPLTAPMVRYKKTLLLASEDFNFYQVNIETGVTGWQFSAGLPIRKAPVVVEDAIYLLPERGGMFELSAKTGTQNWWRARVDDLLAVSPRHVYAVDRVNNLVIMARKNGAVQGVLPLERFTQHVVNDRSDRIYIATPGGLVVCMHETGRDFPLFHLHPEKLPILPEFAPETDDSEPATEGAAEPAKEPAAKEDGEKPEAEKPEAEKPEAEKPQSEKPEPEAKPETESDGKTPAAEKSE